MIALTIGEFDEGLTYVLDANDGEDSQPRTTSTDSLTLTAGTV